MRKNWLGMEMVDSVYIMYLSILIHLSIQIFYNIHIVKGEEREKNLLNILFWLDYSYKDIWIYGASFLFFTKMIEKSKNHHFCDFSTLKLDKKTRFYFNEKAQKTMH